MDEIKEAFRKVKEDFSILEEEMSFLKSSLRENRDELINLSNLLYNLNKDVLSLKADKTRPAVSLSPKEGFQTKEVFLTAQKGQILGISKGNGGVQTDRQTNQQTDRQPSLEGFSKWAESPGAKDSFKIASGLLDSLDGLKKEIRTKFKHLTEQELLVFSTIYQIEEEGLSCDYKLLSKRLNLSESSIRDYVRRLLLKGIPLVKSKVKNKEIQLFISPDLKKIASLNTILKLVEL